ncbi:MAG: hypothetical protein K6U07_10195 [Firmicutes bacterium]|nr:hypothetical protein [Bacillota bacterium]
MRPAKLPSGKPAAACQGPAAQPGGAARPASVPEWPWEEKWGVKKGETPPWDQQVFVYREGMAETSPLGTYLFPPLPGMMKQYWELPLSQAEKTFGQLLWEIYGNSPDSKYVKAFGWEGARELLTNPRKFFGSTFVYKKLISEMGVPQTPEDVRRFFEAYNRHLYEFSAASMRARGVEPPPFEEAWPGWRQE